MFYTVNEIKERVTPIFQSYNVRSAILFGSYAKETANERSDIDLYVDSGLRGLAFFGLLEEISNKFEQNVDLIDSSQVKKNSKVYDEIMKTGVNIYG